MFISLIDNYIYAIMINHSFLTIVDQEYSVQTCCSSTNCSTAQYTTRSAQLGVHSLTKYGHKMLNSDYFLHLAVQQVSGQAGYMHRSHKLTCGFKYYSSFHLSPLFKAYLSRVFFNKLHFCQDVIIMNIPAYHPV